jgi:hypothetical protein
MTGLDRKHSERKQLAQNRLYLLKSKIAQADCIADRINFLYDNRVAMGTTADSKRSKTSLTAIMLFEGKASLKSYTTQ